MRKLVLCAVIALLASAASAASLFGGALAGDVTTFEAFKTKYGRSYASAVEESKRRAIFNQNLERIADARRRNPLATFGVNEFADKTYAEISAKRLRDEKLSPAEDPRDVAPHTYPASIDWRKKGAVTPIVNQGDCGSVICGISFAENVEGVWAAHGFELVPLSVNPAMMCAYPGTCGCYFRQTYDYFMNNQSGRVQTAASWPYNDTQCEAVDQCDLDGRKYGARITGVVQLPQNETAMAFSVGTNGPIAVAVAADDWQTYTSGVLTKCGDSQVDHVAAVVGYDDVSKPPYWIIKNSWGTAWGEDGYIRVAKGSNACGITTLPMTVTVL